MISLLCSWCKTGFKITKIFDYTVQNNLVSQRSQDSTADVVTRPKAAWERKCGLTPSKGQEICVFSEVY